MKMPKRSLRFGMCRHVIESARLFLHIYYSAKIARKVPRQDAIILLISHFWPAIALDLGSGTEGNSGSNVLPGTRLTPHLPCSQYVAGCARSTASQPLECATTSATIAHTWAVLYTTDNAIVGPNSGVISYSSRS